VGNGRGWRGSLTMAGNEPPTGGVIAEGVGCHVNNAVRFGKLPCGIKGGSDEISKETSSD